MEELDQSEYEDVPIVERGGAEKNARGAQDAAGAVDNLTKEWRENHQKRAAEVEAELLGDVPDAGADQRLLMRLAAAEAALSERVTELQVQLVERGLALTNSPTHMVKLARATKDLQGIHSTVGRRVESLLMTASVLRTQRELAPRQRHLKVA